MLELQDLTNELNKFDYYALNSSGGFVVWECNEYLSRNLIEKSMIKYSQITYIDVMNLTRSKYLNLFDIRDNKLNRKKIFVFKNFAEAYAYDNYFDIENLLSELNFTRDVWAKYEYIYVFVLPTFLVDQVMKGSPSFWSYVSIHFRIPNIINNPLPFIKFKKSHTEQYLDKNISLIRLRNNDIVNFYKCAKSDSEKENLLKEMLNLYGAVDNIWDEKILRTIFFNLSRTFSLNKKYREALIYANKCNEIWDSRKAGINVLYCELNMGYRKTKRKIIYSNKPQEMYFLAVEHFAYGNIDISYRLAESYIINNKKENKYRYLFYELLAVLLFAKEEYRSAINVFMEVIFAIDRIKSDDCLDLDVIKNNLNIVSRHLNSK